MEPLRKSYQGVLNIVRFNWHFYFGALLVASILVVISYFATAEFKMASTVFGLMILLTTVLSLVVSHYVYDRSCLYRLSWLKNGPNNTAPEQIVNIHAGYDETSSLLARKYPHSKLIVLDFYDPSKHREISIKRARKAYPPYPNTLSTSSTNIPLSDHSTDRIFLMLSAHEIRDDQERLEFFRELKRVLNKHGQILITEHLRDLANFLAYNLGAFHFHSRNTWVKAFKSAGLRVTSEIKITPFITTFTLEHDPDPS